MMKIKNLLLVIMLASCSMVTLAQSVTINRSDATLESVLLEIADQTSYTLNYSLEVIDADRRVNLSVSKEPLMDVLEKLFAGTQIEFTINENSVDFMMKSKPVQGATASAKFSISGVVTDDNGEPVIGATVLVKDSSNGTITGIDGSFSLNNVTATDQISISYIGYNTQLITIGAKSHFAITLKSSAVDISEVVVVGYGVQKRSDITGSVASVKASELISAPSASTAEALQGKVSGVMIQNSSGSPSGDVTIRIRGANSLTYGNDPLVIVDGVQASSISSLNPNEVESVEVLKDAAALSIYGSRGANGVILVTTKSGSKGKAAEVSYNGYLSFDRVGKTLPTMSASQYGGLYNDYYQAAYGTSYFSDEELQNLGAGTNWQNEIFRNAFSQSHNVSIGGSSEKISYFVSGSLLDNEGIILNSDYRQYTFRSNLKVNASKFFSFGVNAALDSSKESSGDSSAALDAALQWSPTKDVYESDGSYVQAGGGIGPNDKYNPVGLANEYVFDNWGTNIK